MTTYTVTFRTDAEYAERDFEADTPEQALQLGQELWEHAVELLTFENYDMLQPLNGIEIQDEGGNAVLDWIDPDTRVALAAGDLLAALEAQTDAAQSVVDSWEQGDLAGAVRLLDELLPDCRAALARAKGGAL